jgi:hypothetical protein
MNRKKLLNTSRRCILSNEKNIDFTQSLKSLKKINYHWKAFWWHGTGFTVHKYERELTELLDSNKTINMIDLLS